MISLDGVLFFPVTAFHDTLAVDVDSLGAHVERGVAAGPGAVFAAGGTGEFHAPRRTSTGRSSPPRSTPPPVGCRCSPGPADRSPVAVEQVRAASDVGASGVLLLPPYLVDAPGTGLAADRAAVAAATELPIIVYHRANAVFDPVSAAALADIPTVIGLKDGLGDLELLTRIMAAIRSRLGLTWRTFQFFNGLSIRGTHRAGLRGTRGPAVFLRRLLLRPADFAIPSPARWPRTTARRYDDCSTSSSFRWWRCVDGSPAMPCRWSRRRRGCRDSRSAAYGHRWSIRRRSISRRCGGSSTRNRAHRIARAPMSALAVTEIVITPVAFHDLPLLKTRSACTSRWRCVPSSRCAPMPASSRTRRDLRRRRTPRAARGGRPGSDRSRRLCAQPVAAADRHRARRGRPRADRHGTTGQVTATGTVDRASASRSRAWMRRARRLDGR